MSRVRGVVNRAILVHIHDVVAGDVLNIRGEESDPIIERVERDGERVRFHYKQGSRVLASHSNWMHPGDPYGNGCCFINDLRNERAEFLEMADESCVSS